MLFSVSFGFAFDCGSVGAGSFFRMASNEACEPTIRRRTMGLSESREQYISSCDDSVEEEEPYFPKRIMPQVNEDDRKHCSCPNCTVFVENFSECSICLCPMQNLNQPYACSSCGGIWCNTCSSSLKNCPYCRSQLPSKSSVVLKKILKELTLPCRNWRMGCKEFLTSETRQKHESTCVHNQVICDIDPRCSTTLPASELCTHMITHHKATTITELPFSVHIQHFRIKMDGNSLNRNKYKIYVLSFDHIFTIKLTFLNLSLNLFVSRKPIKYEVNDANDVVEASYCVTAEFKSNHIVNKCSWIVRDHNPVRKCVIEKDAYKHFAWSEEVAYLEINIEPISSLEFQKGK